MLRIITIYPTSDYFGELLTGEYNHQTDSAEPIEGPIMIQVIVDGVSYNMRRLMNHIIDVLRGIAFLSDDQIQHINIMAVPPADSKHVLRCGEVEITILELDNYK